MGLLERDTAGVAAGLEMFCAISVGLDSPPNYLQICESASSDFNQTASSFLSPSGKQCRHQHILGETLIRNI